ncbi:LPXTG cell wall anchor domain-containing protein [Ligilactobacillus aviarius]|uniref:LPXTG cell wall anchor domain-containing protein n=1 Tax=Ligilactobacillus aviarius TaxID=1606 RepID=UPI0038908819
MKKITKLVAVSAAAMTFGITGVSALNNTNVVNADNINTDNATLSSKIQEVKNSTNEDGKGYTEFWLETQDINSVANEVENNVNPETVKDHLQNKTADQLSGVYNENNKNGDWNNYRDAYKQDSMTMTGETANEFQGLYQDGTKVLEEIDNYIGGKQQSNQPITQNNNNSNTNKQNTNNANAQNANNNANTQSNSSNKKADVTANANNNNAKNDNAQGAVANKQNTNANAQQNTVKNNANVEGTKTVANENESNSAKNQNNDAIAETQNENTTAAGETSTVVKAQAKSASNSAAQKNNTPVFPQTGEQTSEILAVAGGLIIAATAAGIVVYKKRN